jgi:hypothetical protein
MAQTYADKISGIDAALAAGQIDATTAADLKKEAASSEFGAASFNIDEFQDLLGRLEGSKMRQEGKKGVETRRNTMSQGIASMMANF